METTATREHPILFRPELVRKILDGKKTQTRRPMKWKKLPGDEDIRSWHQDGGGNWIGWSCTERDHPDLGGATKSMYPNGEGFPCPFGQAGDVLWVRESWGDRADYSMIGEVHAERYYYAADGRKSGWKYRPSIHMPKEACRLRLEITDVRVERIQSISAKDIMAQGVVDRAHHSEHFGKCPVSTIDKACYMDLQSLWAAAWEKAYKGSWQRNDWVWVITFKKLESR